MITWRILKNLLLAAIIVLVFSCGEDNGVEPPPTPEQISIHMYSMLEGLPNDDVYDVFMDSQERVWFSTERYIGLLDNGTITRIGQADGLHHPNCRDVVEFNGKIWVGTWGGGVDVYDGASWSRISKSDGLLNEFIYNIACDDSSLWFATLDGVSQYVPSSGTFYSYIKEKPKSKWTQKKKGILADPITSCILITNRSGVDEVWFGSIYGGITIWRPSQQDAIYYNQGNSAMPGDDISDIFYNNKDGKYWVGFINEGVSSLSPATNSWRTYDELDGLTSRIVRSVTADSSGTIWVATNMGVAKLEGGKFTSFARANGLPRDKTREVYVDHQNRIWVVFINQGAGYLE